MVIKPVVRFVARCQRVTVVWLVLGVVCVGLFVVAKVSDVWRRRAAGRVPQRQVRCGVCVCVCVCVRVLHLGGVI